MKVFLVAGGSPSWMSSGWGHSLLSAQARSLLVSFVEYSKAERASMRVVGMVPPYIPKLDEATPDPKIISPLS